MYIPKKEELIDAWLQADKEFPGIYTKKFWNYFSSIIVYSFYKKHFYIWDAMIYPESIEDVKMIIRLITPK